MVGRRSHFDTYVIITGPTPSRAEECFLGSHISKGTMYDSTVSRQHRPLNAQSGKRGAYLVSALDLVCVLAAIEVRRCADMILVFRDDPTCTGNRKRDVVADDTKGRYLVRYQSL